MPVTSIDKNVDDHSIVVTSDFPAPVERIWQLWSDARQLEKWWGPPMYPATVTDFDFVPGGRVKYFMTSPEGEKFGGLWSLESIEAPNRLAFKDAFADGDGNAAEGMPVGACVIELTERDGGTRMVTTTTYGSAEDLAKVVGMGMEEGLTGAIAQIDDMLAAEAA